MRRLPQDVDPKRGDTKPVTIFNVEDKTRDFRDGVGTNVTKNMVFQDCV